MKIIVHIDLNAFFVQCEILRDPSLRGKPVAIGHDSRRGVLSTASYEARKFGVNSAMPVSTAKRQCPQLILVPGHYEIYQQYSHEFFSYLKNRYPILEMASIDECYIDMTDHIKEENINDYLFDLQMALYRVTNLKCSIGCGPNKFLAKMASDMRKPLGLTILDSSNIEQLLWPLSIDKFFGIGVKTAPKLKEVGILTIGDLARTNDPKVKKILGSSFEYYQSEAKGFGSDFVDASSWNPKSVSAERTFQEDATSYEELKDMIQSCCFDISSELKHYHKKAVTVGIKLRTPDFVTKSKRVTLIKPIQEPHELLQAALSVFDKTYKDQPIRLIGVSIDKVVEDEEKKSDENEELIKKINASLEEGGLLMKGSDLHHEDK